jgi:hypothetical protein
MPINAIAAITTNAAIEIPAMNPLFLVKGGFSVCDEDGNELVLVEGSELEIVESVDLVEPDDTVAVWVCTGAERDMAV